MNWVGNNNTARVRGCAKRRLEVGGHQQLDRHYGKSLTLTPTDSSEICLGFVVAISTDVEVRVGQSSVDEHHRAVRINVFVFHKAATYS